MCRTSSTRCVASPPAGPRSTRRSSRSCSATGARSVSPSSRRASARCSSSWQKDDRTPPLRRRSCCPSARSRNTSRASSRSSACRPPTPTIVAFSPSSPTSGRSKLARMATNYERAFAERPEVFEAWGALNGAIKAGMDLRRYELATLAAARRLRSSYCCLAHGKVLAERFGEPVARIAADHRAADLDEVDVAVMDLAEQVADDATSVGEADLQRLRDLGLTETEIMDVVLAAAARCFFSKTLDALGVRPDASYNELEPDVRAALVVGRPIADAL